MLKSVDCFSKIGCKFPKGIEAFEHSFISKVDEFKVIYIEGYASRIEKVSPRKTPYNFKRFTDFNNCSEMKKTLYFQGIKLKDVLHV